MNGTDAATTPARILQLASGVWGTGILGAAAGFRVFTHLAEGASSPELLAGTAGISLRGARALLDGLVGLGLVTVDSGRYANAPDANAFLVEGRTANLSGYARYSAHDLGYWDQYPEAVKTGAPQQSQTTDVPENPFWEELVPAIAALAAPLAGAAATKLGLASAGAVTTLDIGGGSGIYSAVFLRANASARARQLDWPNVNALARDFVAGFGVADRFETLDGDFHATDLGENVYDVVVYSNIAHQETPASNMEVFARIKRALKKGGTLVVSDFVVEDDRSGPPFPLLFASLMLIATKEGSTWTRSQYRSWLEKAGFTSIEMESTAGPSTLICAR